MINSMLFQKNVLDLGCGDGKSAYYIDSLCDINSYVGIDISEKSIIKAKSRNINNTTFRAYDGKNIPYEDNSFDIVFIACVLHHIDVDNRQDILSECYRVLKKGGEIIIFEHNPNNPLTLKTVKDCPFDEGIVLQTARGLKKLLSSVKFECIKVCYTIFMPRKGVFKKLIGVEKYLKWCGLGGQYYIVAKK